MAACGYSDLTVRDLIQRAGVSRRTFYQLFEDKLDCVLAAHERAFDRLSEAIVGACRSRADWADKASAAICAALELAVKEPSDARLIVASCHPAAEPKLAECGRLAQQRLATLLRAGRKQVADPDAPLDLTEQALIGAVMAIVGERLQSDGGSALLALRPELVQIILTPYLGGRAAHQVARRSGG
jgi:AcrR family transcriptional regulator